MPLRSEFSAIGQAGPVTRTLDYSNWKPVQGVNLYGSRTVSENGKVTSKEKIEEWTLNPKIDPSVWQAPAAAAEPAGENKPK